MGVARRLGGKAACHSKQERDDQKSKLHNIGEKTKAPLLVTLSDLLRAGLVPINRVSRGFRTCSQGIMAAMDEVSVRIDDEQQFEDIPESGKFNRPTVAFFF